jgi:hypothetical protein
MSNKDSTNYASLGIFLAAGSQSPYQMSCEAPNFDHNLISVRMIDVKDVVDFGDKTLVALIYCHGQQAFLGV